MTRPIRTAAAGAVALAVAVALGAAPASGDPGDPGGPTGPGGATPPDATHAVTLITGDVVRVTDTGQGPGTATVQRAPGNTGGIAIRQVGDDLHVVPDEVLPYLASGRLDADLFNVTSLIDQGYDDASVDRIPMIVEYRKGLRSAPAAPSYARRGVRLESIHGAALSTDKANAERFWDAVTTGNPRSRSAATARFGSGIAEIHLDETVEATLSESVAQVGAPEVWKEGLDGKGATVAVLDSGIDQTHPDLAKQITTTRSFVPGDDVADAHGHGTHVASTVAGTGAASNGKEKGVAPGADLIAGKVLDDAGNGAASWIIEGMEWGAENADVVNMSLGSRQPSDGTDPMAQALDQLSAETGTLFVVAAGNYGRVSGIGSPGAAEAALTVGAVDSQDRRAAFQDMGPRLGDALVKPEIVAPGVEIRAARSAQSPGSGSYTTMSGTSMATPHVAGAAAIIAQQHPGWNGQQIKRALVSTALPLDGQTAYQVGGGRLDVPSSVHAEVVATATRDFGRFTWPHGDDDPVERTITYTNLTDAPVTLDLATDVTDADLNPAPEGLVTLGKEAVTVPAKGTAEVTVTADPDLGKAGTTYSGTVIASQRGEQVAQTAVGLVKEEERYDLDVSAVDRRGHAAGGFLTLYRYGDKFVTTLEIDPETGTVPTQRLLPGVYNVTTWLPLDGKRDNEGVALLGDPHLVVDGDTRLRLDARDANPVTSRTPKRSETSYLRSGYVHDSGIGGDYDTFVNQYDVAPNIDRLYAAPTGEVAGDQFEYVTRWRRTAPLLTIRARPGNTRLDPLYQAGSKRWDGKRMLRAVSAGNGTPSEYADVRARNRAVLVMRNDSITPAAQASAAADAGAAMLLIVNDRPGEMYEYVAGTDVPVVGLTGAQGEPLVDRLARGRRVRLQVRGVEAPPYLYDLVDTHEGEIPDDLRYAPRKKDLATVTNRFVGNKGELAFESRTDCREWSWPPCLGPTVPVHLGTTRVDYLSTDDGTEWYEQASQPGWSLRGLRHSYAAGDDVVNSWFEPVARPRVGEGYWHPRRSGDFFAVNVPELSSGDEGVTGAMDDPDATVESRLYANGELVRSSPFQAVQTVVPATSGWSEYRFEMDTTRPRRPWKTSTRTSTTWDFRAETSPTDSWTFLPLLQLDYHVETDLRGRMRHGRRTLGLSASHLEDVVGAGGIDRATLEVSFTNGRRWQRTTLRSSGEDEWTTSVRVPAKARYLSLRAVAEDEEGNRVRQQVIRAVRIR